MRMNGNDLTLFFIFFVLGHHPSQDNLERKMYTKQRRRTGRLVVDMKGMIGNN